MDSMHQPREFPRVFTGSYLYIFTLTLPSAATMYAAFPTLSGQNGKPVMTRLLQVHVSHDSRQAAVELYLHITCITVPLQITSVPTAKSMQQCTL